MAESLVIDVDLPAKAGSHASKTTALPYPSEENKRIGATLLLAHGAGAGHQSRFILDFARGLAARGIDVLTFNFLYTEQKRKLPDRTELLEACFRAVIEAARSYAPCAGNRIFIGGKSMGGRIASHLAAEDRGPLKVRAAPLSGLILLGYPLHPPGKPETLRVAHLATINVPVLVVQGERDPFGTPEELRPHLAFIPARVTLHVVERGDHSLAPPKKGGPTVDQVYSELQDVIAAWIKAQL